MTHTQFFETLIIVIYLQTTIDIKLKWTNFLKVLIILELVVVGWYFVFSFFFFSLGGNFTIKSAFFFFSAFKAGLFFVVVLG